MIHDVVYLASVYLSLSMSLCSAADGIEDSALLVTAGVCQNFDSMYASEQPVRVSVGSA
jgi:hypothetical protein